MSTDFEALASAVQDPGSDAPRRCKRRCKTCVTGATSSGDTLARIHAFVTAHGGRWDGEVYELAAGAGIDGSLLPLKALLRGDHYALHYHAGLSVEHRRRKGRRSVTIHAFYVINTTEEKS